MAISHDVTTVSAAAYTSTGTQNTTHAAGASAKGAVVLIAQNGSTADQVSGVTYGGQSMTRVRFNTESTEAGGVYIYWLSGIPTGSQTVAMTTTGTASKRLTVSTMNVAAGVPAIKITGQNSATSTSGANPTVTITGLNSAETHLGFLVIHSGLQTMTTTAGASWTRITSVDLGSQGNGFARLTTPTSGITSLACNWVAATADDYVIAAVTFAEDLTQTVTPTGISDPFALGTPVGSVGPVTVSLNGINKSSNNLVSNFGFETDTSGWFVGSGGTMARTTTDEYTGVASLQVTSTVTGGTTCWVAVGVTLTVGNVYRISARIKKVSGGTIGIQAYMNGTYGTSATAVTTGWTDVSLVKVADLASDFAYFVATTVTTGDVFLVDQVEVVDLGLGQPALSKRPNESWGFLHNDAVGQYLPGYSLYLDASLPESYPGSGTTWTDLSGNGRNGTLTSGPTYSAGRGAIVFDGTDDYVTGTIPTTTMSSFCMQGWVNITGGTNGGCFFKMGGNSGGIALGIGTSTFEDTGTNLVALFPAIRWIPTTTSLGSGWKFVSMNMDASSVPTFYINGTLVSGTYSGTAPAAPTTSYNLGRCIGDEGTGRQFQGQIGSFVCYNRVVTAQEVKINFERTRSKYGV